MYTYSRVSYMKHNLKYFWRIQHYFRYLQKNIEYG